jgi:hypothetical protein
MRRCLLVLDRDLATADEPKPGPVSYLAAGQEEEPCEVVVLGLVRSRQVGCHAIGISTRQRQLGLAVRGEIHGRHYDEVILVTGRSSGTWLTRLLRLDPVHRLRLRLGHRLTVFPLGAPVPQAVPVS